jgi:hypothetical protein
MHRLYPQPPGALRAMSMTYRDCFTFTFAFLILSIRWRWGISFPLRLIYPSDERVWLRNDVCPVTERLAPVPVAYRNPVDNAVASHQLFKAKWFILYVIRFFLTFRNCSFSLQCTFIYFVSISERIAIIPLLFFYFLFFFVIETECVYCAWRTESLNVIEVNFVFQGLKLISVLCCLQGRHPSGILLSVLQTAIL